MPTTDLMTMVIRIWLGSVTITQIMMQYGRGCSAGAKEEKQQADVQTGDLETHNLLKRLEQWEAKKPGRLRPTTVCQR